MSINFEKVFKEFSQEGLQRNPITGRYRYTEYSRYLCLSFKHWCYYKGYPFNALRTQLELHLEKRFPGFKANDSLESYFYRLLFGNPKEEHRDDINLADHLAIIARVQVMKSFLEND